MPDKIENKAYAIALAPSVSRRLHFVNRSQLQLNATLGQMPDEDEERVIVGVVEIQIEAEALIDDKSKPPFTVELRLPVENTAYLLSDMLSDFAGVCKGIARLSSKDTAPAQDRIEMVSAFLEAMKESIQLAESALRDIPLLKPGVRK